MGRVIEPLTRMGASIQGRDGNRLPPLCIRGGRSADPVRNAGGFRAGEVVPAARGLYAATPVTVVEPIRSRDHTERMLTSMGAGVTRDGNAVTVAPCVRLDPMEITVPGDLSSAAFFLVLAAVTPGSSLTVSGVGVNPFRTGVLGVLRRMGADIRRVGERFEGGNRCGPGRPGAELVAARVAPEEVPA